MSQILLTGVAKSHWIENLNQFYRLFFSGKKIKLFEYFIDFTLSLTKIVIKFTLG